MGRKTTYAYVSNASGTTITTTLPDGVSKEVKQYDLDGLLVSDSGDAVAAPTAGDEGVIASDIHDASGNLIPAGSTWTQSLSNGGATWTRVYTNLLGQQVLTQQSEDAGVQKSATQFDGNGRPAQTKNFDHSVTHTVYSPVAGQSSAIWVDRNGDGVFTPGTDSRSLSLLAPANSADVATMNQSIAQSGSGDQVSASTSSNAGLHTQDTTSGITTTSDTILLGGGAEDVTTTNPDGTKTVDHYQQGLLMEEDHLGTDGSTTASTSYEYDGLRRLYRIHDWRGTTSFDLLADGSVQTVHLPDGRVQMVAQRDPNTGVPTNVNRFDSQVIQQGIDGAGRPTSQGGAGTTLATFGYDAGTGGLGNITTYGANTAEGAGVAVTRFQYDPLTSLLSSKTYADDSKESYLYNPATGLLDQLLKPGTAATFQYNNAGEQTGVATKDTATNATINDSSNALDDLGRPHCVSEVQTDGSGTVTSAVGNILNYTALNQLALETQAAGIATKYDYYATDDTSPNAAPGALKSIKLLQDGNTVSETDYAYDPVSRRLQTVTVNGIPFRYDYKPQTDLIATIGNGTVVTQFDYDPGHNAVSSIKAFGSDIQLFSAGYLYNANDQRSDETISQQTIAGTQQEFGYHYLHDGQDQLQTVTATSGDVPGYAYTFDGVGNDESLGTVNALNQPTAYQFNGRGDLTDDGTFAYSWDAKDRLIAVVPKNPVAGSLKTAYAYDAQDRRIQKDVYAWDGSLNGGTGGWGLSYTRKYAYNGIELVAELDGNNHLVTSYAWGAGGLADGLVAITDWTGAAPVTYVPVYDGSDNIVQLIDASSGSLAATFAYDPFRSVIDAQGPAANVGSIRGGGMVWDAEVGLNYAGARYLKGDRLLSRDPSGEASDVNLYRPFDDDPINKVDPTGLTGVNMDLYRSTSQVWNEAKQEIQEKYGLPVSTPWGQVVPGTGVLGHFQKTYGDLVAASYNAKVSWYEWGQGSTLYSGKPIQVISDSDYARKQAIENLPADVTADTRTPAQRQAADNLYQVQWRIAHSEPVAPDALEAAQINLANDSLVGAIRAAISARKETIAMTMVGAAVLSGRQPGPNFNSNFVPRTGVTINGEPQKTLAPQGELVYRPNGDVQFRGMTVQVQEDLTHISTARLEDMAEFGTAPVTEDGDVITLHHVNQNAGGPLWEIPGPLNDVNNTELHPFGNAPGSGLTLQQRAAFNGWRTAYWKARAEEELARRNFQRNGGIE